MNRLTHCGLATVFFVIGCGAIGCGIGERPLPEQRNDAISDYQVGRFEQSQAKFKQIVDHHPGDSMSYFYMGRISHSQGRQDWAIYYYRLALTYDPSNTQAQQWLDRALKEAPAAEPIDEVLYKNRAATEPAATPEGG